MLDNQTRRELLSKARQSGFPGSILDVFTAYEQGKDLIGEFQQQQQQQQIQQMSDTAAQQVGMMPPGQQPLPQEMPQIPAGPPPGLQGQNLPSPPPPSNSNLVDSTQQQPTGMATNAKGSSGGQVIMANGGFVEKFTEDQYNKFSTHFPFSKEQRGSIAHNATVEHPDLTMVNPKKYVFGGLKYALGGKETDPPSYTLPTLEVQATRNAPIPKMLEPGFQDELAYLEAKNKLKLRTDFESAQARNADGPNFWEFVKNGDKAQQALREMYKKYPNDKRLRAKEERVSESLGKWIIQDGIERLLFKGAPRLSNNANYQYAVQGLKKGNNVLGPILNIQEVQDAQQQGKNEYAYYTEELQKKVDDYEKAHGTYKPGFFEKMRKTHFKFATGGLEGDPLKKANIATADDSAWVAEAADAPHNFYKKAGYISLPKEVTLNIQPSEIFDALANERRFMYINQHSPLRSASYSDYTNYKPGQHRFEQRELTTGQINLKAPRSRYDDRILPQGLISYAGTAKNGDLAEVPKYDKLAVTPWGNLSDAEKLKRLQKYGSSGTPYKDKASLKQAIIDLKNPVPLHLDMKEATKFPMPQVNIKPQFTSLPIPQTTKQRVVINTPQGDKIRVQDIKTKKFLGWEDEKGLPSDVDTPSGTASQDFPEMRRIKTPAFAKGGFKILKKRK